MTNPVQAFFSALSTGDIEAALSHVHPDTVFHAQGPETVPIYGQFPGHSGVRKFIETLQQLFDTEAFDFYHWVHQGDIVFASGYMQHKLKRTGKVFKSEWALVGELKDNQIISYKMFEDTDALVNAYH